MNRMDFERGHIMENMTLLDFKVQVVKLPQPKAFLIFEAFLKLKAGIHYILANLLSYNN